ncbi:hypothetical protein IJL65_00110 [bacterium]|nr:hypothetical protein [bacterium]
MFPILFQAVPSLFFTSSHVIIVNHVNNVHVSIVTSFPVVVFLSFEEPHHPHQPHHPHELTFCRLAVITKSSAGMVCGISLSHHKNVYHALVGFAGIVISVQ